MLKPFNANLKDTEKCGW